MNIPYFNYLSHYPASLFKDLILPALTVQQKKIILIASVALSCFAVCYVAYQCCFKAKPWPDEEKQKDSLSNNDLKKDTFKEAEPLSIEEEVSNLTLEQVNPITLPIDKENLPKYVFSKIGSIGNAHLMHYLNKENPPNRDEIILWSFSKRKFQSLGSRLDTLRMRRDSSYLAGTRLLIDSKGQAISASAHPVDIMQFITDEEIIKVDDCTTYEEHNKAGDEKLLIGYYPDGKCMIHQPGVRSCVFTSAAMVLLDHKIDFDLNSLYRTNLENDDGLNRLLNKYGYQLKALNNNTPELQAWISTNGSLLVSICDANIGSHQLVVDTIDDHVVTIREPAHGWRITISKERFDKMRPAYSGIDLIRAN